MLCGAIDRDGEHVVYKVGNGLLAMNVSWLVVTVFKNKEYKVYFRLEPRVFKPKNKRKKGDPEYSLINLL